MRKRSVQIEQKIDQFRLTTRAFNWRYNMLDVFKIKEKITDLVRNKKTQLPPCQ